VKLTTRLHLVPKSKNAWSYTSTPQYAFMEWCLVKHRDHFTFTLSMMNNLCCFSLLFLPVPTARRRIVKVGVKAQTFLISTLNGDELSDTRAFCLPTGKSSRNLLHGILGGPQSRPGCGDEVKNLVPIGNRNPICRSSLSYSLY
jgi:hypothetical protein